jgi:hypothetical protein
MYEFVYHEKSLKSDILLVLMEVEALLNHSRNNILWVH